MVDSEQEEEVGREEEASRFTVPTDWTIQVDSSQGVLNAVRRWLLPGNVYFAPSCFTVALCFSQDDRGRDCDYVAEGGQASMIWFAVVLVFCLLTVKFLPAVSCTCGGYLVAQQWTVGKTSH